MKAVKDDVKKYQIKERIEFEDDLYLTISPYFKPEKISVLLESLAADISDAEDEGIEVNDFNFVDLILYYITKVFSDLHIPTDPKRNFQFFRDFINSSYFPTIMQSYPEEELQKVFDKAHDTLEQYEYFKTKIKNMQQEIQEYDFQSPELKGRIQGRKQIPER